VSGRSGETPAVIHAAPRYAAKHNPAITASARRLFGCILDVLPLKTRLYFDEQTADLKCLSELGQGDAFAVCYFRELWRLFSDRRKCLAVRVGNTQMELQEVS